MSVPNLQPLWPKFTRENVRPLRQIYLICLAFQYQNVACKQAPLNATWSIEALQLPVLLLRHHMSSLQHIFQHEDPPSDASEGGSIWIMTHLTRKLDWLGPSDKGMNYPDVSFSNLSTSSYKHLTSVHSSLPADEWNNKSIDSKMDSVIDRCNMVVIMMRPGIQCWWFISIVTHRPSHTFWSKGCKLSREIPAMSLDRARPSIIGLGNRCNPAKPEPRDIGPAVTWSLDSI